MNLLTLAYKSILHHRKTTLPVLLGSAIGIAIITGALMIADSKNQSLLNIAHQRLGNCTHAITSGEQFVTKKLGEKLQQSLNVPVASTIFHTGFAVAGSSQARANQVNIIGVDGSFDAIAHTQQIFSELKNGIAINQKLADKLNVAVGDELIIRFAQKSRIPLNSPLVSDQGMLQSARLTVQHILSAEASGNFDLKANQVAPFNIFVDCEWLADKLDAEGLVNRILVAGPSLSPVQIDSTLSNLISISDAGLSIRHGDQNDMWHVFTDRIFFAPPIFESLTVISEIQQQPVISYFANALSTEKYATPYSFVSAPSDHFFATPLQQGEMVINQWLAEDLHAKRGDTLTMAYFQTGPMRTLIEQSDQFIVKDIIKMDDPRLQQPLVPEFPGLSDVDDCNDWDAGIPIDLKKIRDKDEDYWDAYRTTPKAFINQEQAATMWDSRFGIYTSIDIQAAGLDSLSLSQKIVSVLSPSQIGLSILPVQQLANYSVMHGTDFGGLFIGLSFVLIVAALILIGMLFMLNLHMRRHEYGLMRAVGLEKWQVVRVAFYEVVMILLPAAIMGALLGIVYQEAIVHALNGVWVDTVRSGMITAVVRPSTIAISMLSGIVIILPIFWLKIRRMAKFAPLFLLKNTSALNRSKSRIMWDKATVFIATPIIVVLAVAGNMNLIDPTANFFILGFCVLVLGIAFLSLQVQRNAIKTPTIFTLRTLSTKSIDAFRSRNISAAMMLALGVFIVIATGSNKTDSNIQGLESGSGTGGFAIWAESDVPVLHNLNTAEMRYEYGLDDPTWEQVSIVQMKLLDGEDASCLNLNQAQQPQILGVDPETFIDNRSFSFAKNLDNNGWAALGSTAEANVIPAIADQTVLQWGLQKSLGDTLYYVDEAGHRLGLRLVAGLKNSVFQGKILIDQKHFQKHFPTVSGSRVMLVSCRDSLASEVMQTLDASFRDYGMVTQLTTDRLNEFNSVQNTYLSIFAALGSIGLLLGTIGLGLVLMRNVEERKTEMGLLLAIGFTKAKVLRQLIREHSFIVLAGLAIGSVASLVAILPSWMNGTLNISLWSLVSLIVVLLLSSLLWLVVSATLALRGVLIQSLKGE